MKILHAALRDVTTDSDLQVGAHKKGMTAATTLYGSLRLRPTRIGFLVSPTNMGELRRIMQICNCLWGGAFNPIIPICDELPEAWSEYPLRTPSGAEVTKPRPSDVVSAISSSEDAETAEVESDGAGGADDGDGGERNERN